MPKLRESVMVALALGSLTALACADDFMMGGDIDLGPLRFGLFYFGTFVVLELVVFIIEGLTYRFALGLKPSQAFLASLVANLASATTGLVINVVVLATPRWLRYPLGLVVTLCVELPIVLALVPRLPSLKPNAPEPAGHSAWADRRRVLGCAAVVNLMTYTIGRTILTSIWMAHVMKGG
jgi:hypothetical protein